MAVVEFRQVFQEGRCNVGIATLGWTRDTRHSGLSPYLNFCHLHFTVPDFHFIHISESSPFCSFKILLHHHRCFSFCFLFSFLTLFQSFLLGSFSGWMMVFCHNKNIAIWGGPGACCPQFPSLGFISLFEACIFPPFFPPSTFSVHHSF